MHPAVVAQAAATASLMLEGRFVLGVGSGEALNEHVLGDRWPPADPRLQMLEEAVEVMRQLWQGGEGPTMAQLKVCWADDEARARKTAFGLWKSTAVPGEFDAGFDELYATQIGDHSGFFDFYTEEMRPKLSL